MSQHPQNGSINPTNSIMERLGPRSSLAVSGFNTLSSQCRGPRLGPWSRTISTCCNYKIPCAAAKIQCSQIDRLGPELYLLISNHCNHSKNCWVSKSQITSGPKNSQNVSLFPWKVPLEGRLWEWWLYVLPQSKGDPASTSINRV